MYSKLIMEKGKIRSFLSSIFKDGITLVYLITNKIASGIRKVLATTTKNINGLFGPPAISDSGNQNSKNAIIIDGISRG